MGRALLQGFLRQPPLLLFPLGLLLLPIGVFGYKLSFNQHAFGMRRGKMGRRCGLSCRWIICVVMVASAIYRVEGLSMVLSEVSSVYPAQNKEINSESTTAPRSASLPKVAFSPIDGAVTPGVLPVMPSVSSPAPSVHVTTGHKRLRASVPSLKNQPNANIASGPPRYSRPGPSNKSLIRPRKAPTTAFAPPAIDLHGSVAPPKSRTSAFSSAKRDGTPVAAPPTEMHRHLVPTNNSPSKAPMVTPAPEVIPKYSRPHHASPFHQGPSFSPTLAPAPSQSSPIPSGSNEWLNHSPTISPSSHPVTSSAAPPPPIWLLPPPPPNMDCNWLICTEPSTNPPPGSPCICVLPIRVGLRLSVTLYTFFPLVPQFAEEIAFGIYMKQSQVRIMGANVASDEPENTIVLIDLVPREELFDNTTAFLTFEKFWHKDIVINTSLFGEYAVLYVLYPGLPPSPPRAPADINFGDGTSGNSNNGRTIKPLGVDVRKQKEKTSGNLIAVIVLSSFVALTLCVGAAWFLLLKKRCHSHMAAAHLHKVLPLFARTSGTKHMMLGNRPCSESASFSSSVATYTGSAKTFTLAEIEKATNRFDESKIIGEGGFGRVYQGTLEDGIRVAVKVLKRDDQQSGREFFAEVEMLNRLHHRNLVKLIGICMGEAARCLVYELVPNGSVESHLHGVDKETAPLDWNSRMKITLGAARGLAYLHEDSSPRVIHRDFKSSNILLEHDYTPKVSDFGLARAALDEGNLHISTRVMGTFGYVAPEYAMTGHLLVKSDVYSFGVVLLELLTGRKPIDMLQPPGQENLVTWARPLLTNMDNLEMIVDPALAMNVPIDSIAKVAAIASMCVQPEVSHRPFMGEVVQALKLVCNECNQNIGTESCSQNELPNRDTAARVSNGSGLEAERVLLASDILSTSTRFDQDESGSFQTHSNSGPLIMSKSRQFWQRLRSLSTGSVSERGAAQRFGIGSECGEQWS
nr:PREDICTED: receptor-like serine/threonine-protein kinase ALE2 isoform X2 [Musa acuminata subsp. malaccensis]